MDSESRSTRADMAVEGAPEAPVIPPPVGPRKVRRGIHFREDVYLPYVLLFPAILIVLGTLIVPLFILGNLSLRDIDLATLEDVFQAPLTTRHYESVLSNPDTWRSLRISFLYVVGTTSLAFAVGFGTALLLKQVFPGQRVFRTLLLVPWAIPGVTATVAFLWMLTPTFGVVNYILRTLGLITTDINWFGNPDTALIAVILPTAWKAYPFFAVMLLAGLQSIPDEWYEAAAVDGAGIWNQFRYVTWPGVKRFAILALIFNGMHTFREFDFIFAATQGGPSGATETIAIRVYNEAFQAFRLGSASALGIVTFLLVVGFVILALRKQSRSSFEGI